VVRHLPIARTDLRRQRHRLHKQCRSDAGNHGACPATGSHARSPSSTEGQQKLKVYEAIELYERGYRFWLTCAGYDILTRDSGEPAIRCHRCTLISHNPNDLRERYCGNCRVFHGASVEYGARMGKPEVGTMRTFSHVGVRIRLGFDHHLVQEHPRRVCPGCDRVFAPGETIGMITIGPGPDPEEREKARNGRGYIAVALPVHWACATGEEDSPEAPLPRVASLR
jgi:hypothetical protein